MATSIGFSILGGGGIVAQYWKNHCRFAPTQGFVLAGGLASVLLTAVLVKFKIGLRPLPPLPAGELSLTSVRAPSAAEAAFANGGSKDVMTLSLSSDPAAHLRRKSKVTLSQSFRYAGGGMV
jgi:hypothetical protein